MFFIVHKISRIRNYNYKRPTVRSKYNGIKDLGRGFSVTRCNLMTVKLLILLGKGRNYKITSTVLPVASLKIFVLRVHSVALRTLL